MLSLTVARILFRFSKGSGVMVESPTYYHSLSPVLRSLKEFDMENFPLQAEVIYAQPAVEFPGYLKDATFEASIICSSQTTGTAKETQEDKPGEVKDSSNISEASDRENLQDMKVNDCVSPGNNMTIENSSKLVGTCDSTINAECSLREKLTLKTQSIKHMLEFCNLLTKIGKRINIPFYINPSNIESALPDDKSVEQMDTDGILENSLHSKSSLKTEQSVKINEPANTGTFLVHPPSASTSSEQGETDSEENSGRRMNVECFFEIFNSLETSQRDALVHALTNKLAVIQGQYVIMARC